MKISTDLKAKDHTKLFLDAYALYEVITNVEATCFASQFFEEYISQKIFINSLDLFFTLEHFKDPIDNVGDCDSDV